MIDHKNSDIVMFISFIILLLYYYSWFDGLLRCNCIVSLWRSCNLLCSSTQIYNSSCLVSFLNFFSNGICLLINLFLRNWFSFCNLLCSYFSVNRIHYHLLCHDKCLRWMSLQKTNLPL